ncbi:MAG: hypothetical protein ACKVQK_21765 [Burkholderiales bacterium]
MRSAFAIAAFAATTFANAQTPRFEDAVGYEIYQIVRANDVALSPGGKTYHPTFYSVETNKIEEVRCERTAIFGLITKANLSGNLLVSICENEANRVRALARDAKRGLSAVVTELRAGGAKIDDAMLAKAGWTYQNINAADGEEHHFAVLLIGHGIDGPQTMVFAPRGERGVIVVQADVRRHCENYGLDSSALCANTRAALAQLGRSVLKRVAR